MARRRFRTYIRTSRRRKLTFGKFLMSWVLPSIGVAIPVLIFLAHFGYITINK
ncbi:hypothetical protein [Columbia Basin potato purple top phytoplasma]|uniref:Sugar ABC transporter permease n=1 Tax=Columbia Basin potato purple top phytoplasma TaxID=307134 RepID=A0ABT5L9V2_9MOLU|nr:hypothetical protein [Columbia Basin potato purple top phytoplasma]MDC9032277.1 hypothetical protein [Columbia Basin potato purple top phytoplasma]